MAVGNSNFFKNAHNKAELYYHSTSSWETKASYPFQEAISSFEILAHSDSFILFGGLYYDEKLSTGLDTTDIVAKFNPGSNRWTKLGKLQHNRHAFGVIEIDTKYLVMGGGPSGGGEMRTETCVLENETIECTSREPTLKGFWNPALMTVSSDYADNC